MENKDLLAKINEIQTEINKLRAEGVDKIDKINEKIAFINKTKKMDKAAKAESIQNLKDEKVAFVAKKKENAPRVKELVAEGRALTNEYYAPLLANLALETKQNKAKIKAEHKANLKEIKAKHINRMAQFKNSNLTGEDKKVEAKRNKLMYKNDLHEEQSDFHSKYQKEKDELHNLYLEKMNVIGNLSDDKLTIKEKLIDSWTNYAYSFNLKEFFMKNGLYIIIVLFMILCIISNPALIGINSVMNILKNFSTKVFFALGVAGLILLAGTDLSIGRMVTLCSLLTCMMLNPDTNTKFFGMELSNIYGAIGFVPTAILAFLFSIIVAVSFSMLAGFFTSKFKIHPFITTLGTSLIIWGIAGYGTNNVKTGTVTDEALAITHNIFQTETFPGIPLTLIYAIIAIAVIWFIWNKTKFGKNMYAVGGNQEAASVSGISVFWTTMGVFIMAGVLYGIGAFLIGIQTGSSSSTLGQGWELEAIAACVVGGISFSGGIGKIRGAVVGCLLFEILKYYLRDITNGSADITNIFIGIIILVAVIFDSIKYLKKK